MQQQTQIGMARRGLALGLLAMLAYTLPAVGLSHNPQVSFDEIRPTIGDLRLRFDASISIPETAATGAESVSLATPAAIEPAAVSPATTAAPVTAEPSRTPPQPVWTAAARNESPMGRMEGSGASPTISRSAEAKTTMMGLILGTIFVVTVGSLVIMRLRSHRERPLISPFDASYRKTTQVSLPENL